MINVYTDGATVGHNGKLGTVSEIGLGIYIVHNGGVILKRSIKCKGISNNEAEFMALIFAMQIIRDAKTDCEDITFNSDAKIIVNRANNKKRPKGKYKNERMDNFQDTVLYLKSKLEKRKNNIKFVWIPREENTIADQLSKDACELVEITPFLLTAPKKEPDLRKPTLF